MIQALKTLRKGFAAVWRDDIAFLAGGVAFYALLSLAPLLAALVAVYGLVTTPADLYDQLILLADLLPAEAFRILEAQLSAAIDETPQGLTLMAVLSLLLSLYSATRGTKALMAALNRIFGVEQRRGFFRRNIVAFGATSALIVGAVLAMMLVVALPAVLDLFLLPEWLKGQIAGARWILLSLAGWGGIAILLHMAPYRAQRKQRAALLGAGAASLLWLLGSWGLSAYIAWFPNSVKIYGAMTAVVLLMLWFYISAYAILLGGGVAAAIEVRHKNSYSR